MDGVFIGDLIAPTHTDLTGLVINRAIDACILQADKRFGYDVAYGEKIK